jgi:hypothetical protein
MEKVESTKTTYSQMALSMAEEEAARLSNEIHSVREKTERTEAMKETLKKEIKRLVRRRHKRNSKPAETKKRSGRNTSK